MQKVEGSSPFIRFTKTLLRQGFCVKGHLPDLRAYPLSQRLVSFGRRRVAVDLDDQERQVAVTVSLNHVHDTHAAVVAVRDHLPDAERFREHDRPERFTVGRDERIREHDVPRVRTPQPGTGTQLSLPARRSRSVEFRRFRGRGGVARSGSVLVATESVKGPFGPLVSAICQQRRFRRPRTRPC